MDYEKKYKEALEKARQLCAYPTTKPFISDLQDIFPELTESEDEKIRKEIVNTLHSYAKRLEEKIPTEWFVWLEKQGEHKCDCKYVGCHVNNMKRWCHKKQSEILCEKCNTKCSEYLKQGEQKPNKCMYSKDNYTDKDRKVLCDGCEEECKYTRKEADWLQELQCKLDSMSKEDFERVWKKYETEAVSDDEIEKQFKAGDVVVYVSRQPAYSGLYLLGNPNDLSIGYSNANEPYQIALRNCTVASEDERKQFMRELESNGYKWNENTLRIEKVETVSEELEEAAKNHAVERYRATRDMVLAEKCKWSFKAGAEWQKKRDYIPLSDDINEVARQICNKVLNCEINYKENDVILSDEGECVKAGIRWQMQKESIPSKDLEELINSLSKQFQEVSFAKLSRIAVRVAKWQKEQFEKNRLAACDRASREEIEREQDFCDKIIIGEHRQPTYSDAIEYGIDWQKKQMMKEAIEREVKEDAGGYPYIPQMELYDYDKDIPLAKEGDKYKVVLIKEE